MPREYPHQDNSLELKKKKKLDNILHEIIQKNFVLVSQTRHFNGNDGFSISIGNSKKYLPLKNVVINALTRSCSFIEL